MLTSSVSLQQGNIKKSKKSMKIINIKGENLLMTRGVSRKFSGKIWLIIILKVKKNRLSPSL